MSVLASSLDSVRPSTLLLSCETRLTTLFIALLLGLGTWVQGGGSSGIYLHGHFLILHSYLYYYASSSETVVRSIVAALGRGSFPSVDQLPVDGTRFRHYSRVVQRVQGHAAVLLICRSTLF